MTSKDRIRRYEERAAILEKIAGQYHEGSKEYNAIREAAIALWYALTEQQGGFVDYLAKWERGALTAEEEAHLRSIGIDPDSAGGTAAGGSSARGRQRRRNTRAR